MSTLAKITVLIAALFLTSCGIDNGLPSDLLAHLKTRGVHVDFIGSVAPIFSRAGTVEITPDIELQTVLIKAFELQPETNSRARLMCMQHVDQPALEIWVVAGRPGSLRLKSGARFEYLCLVLDSSNRSYLVAEYAYG
jgi:hypothetical protein